MKKHCSARTLAAFALAAVLLVSCDESRNKATLGGTRDTTSVNKAGGPPISDTAAISRNRRDSAGRKNSPANGNADPSGRIKNQ